MSSPFALARRHGFGLVVAVFAIGLLWPLRVPADDSVLPPPIHVVTKDRTTVEIMDPASPLRYYRGARFTPLATVLGVKVKGREYLYHPAKHQALEDDCGLATEFDLCIPGGPDDDSPPGYLDAGVGDGFLKIGVGVLRKQQQPYSLFQQNEVIELAKTTVVWTDDGARYHQICGGVRGYAYELGAVIEVKPNQVIIRWELTNTGTKKLVTKQYTHDFIRLGDHDVGEGYVLSFPYDFQAVGLEAGQQQQARNILFKAPIPTWINAVVPYPSDYQGPNTFLLKYTGTGQAIQGAVSLPGLRTAIHARKGYIAPEQFIRVTVAPGQKTTWSRTYDFWE